ncbi:hypothetical protein N7490_012228 [Penicillium lividum]|nr:hypothetical protein N7490_012228 [Penicillium lividum]
MNSGKDTPIELEFVSTEQPGSKSNPEDGDIALEFLQTHAQEYTKEEERRVMRKVDIRMVTIMLVINGIQFVDQNTLSSAGTYGIQTQAHLVGQEFSLLVTIFYIGYLIAQYPANLIMQRWPIGKVLVYLSSTNILSAARFFLGVFESCLNPGFVLITSAWWKREEQPARGIAHINVDGMFSYQWMFIIFAGFLTERERYIVVHRMSSNRTGVKNTHLKREQIMEALLDVRIWLLVFAIFAHNMTNALQTTFMSIIIKGFGYSTYQAVLLNIPPSVILWVWPWSPSASLSPPRIISTAMLFSLPFNAKNAHLGAVYIVPFVAVAAGIMYSLLASNVAGYTKKVFTGTLFFSSNCVSNIISPQVFLTREAPYYHTGIATCLAAFSINILLFSLLYFLYSRENKARDKDFEGVIMDHEDLNNAFSDLTDRENKMLRYKL